MKPELVKFELSHLTAFEHRANAERVPVALRELQRWPNLAYSALLDGKIVGCGGMICYPDGLGSVWIAASRALDPYRLWLTRTVHRYLLPVARYLSVRWIMTEAIIDSDSHCRWIKQFGFKPVVPEEILEFSGVKYRVYALEVG